MKKLGKFKIFGCPHGSEKSLRLDEIVILANPSVLRHLGEFLILSAYEIENDAEHLHLQDSVENFSYRDHVDVIAVNQKISKKK